MTYLAVPIAADDLAKAARQVESALAWGAEMVELRLDYLRNLSPDLSERLVLQTREAAARPVKVTATCRDKREGGAFAYPQSLRVEALIAALKASVDFIDLEYGNFLQPGVQERIRAELSQSRKAGLILSCHEFKTKFKDIRKLYNDVAASYPGAIPKLVYTANHINDCFEAFDLLHETGGDRTIFCMGEEGLVSRVIAQKLNSFVTFASLGRESETASGQWTIGQWKGVHRFDGLDSDSELFGIIAGAGGGFPDPLVYNACLARNEINKFYLPLVVRGGRSEFDDFLDHVLSREWLGFRGFTVANPHKQNALAYVRAKGGFVERLAEKAGAVDTVSVGPQGALAAYNTGYAAFMEAINSELNITGEGLKGLPVAIIGCSAAARPIAAGLSGAGAKLRIYDRTVRKVQQFAGEFGCAYGGLDELSGLEAKLVINCTRAGMYPNANESPLPPGSIKEHMAVLDTVYDPPDTLLRKQARKAGAENAGGLSMVTSQVLAQFKLLTGRDADPELVRRTISGRFSGNH